MSVEGVADLERTLHERFGLEQFRPGQREVIEDVLRGKDVLCVMPTGGGKSLCYQLPAVLLPGLTLVVSPLIALMKDQVDALQQRGIRATLINSTLDPSEQRTRIQEVASGHYDLVYVAPERFRSARFVETVARAKPALLAIDEAHCISEWGHDFRPDYARIGLARRRLGSPPCIALTATATDLVRRDIADQLDLRDPSHFVTGFDRPNLGYSVVEARKDADKLAALAEILDQNPGAAVVYTSSRNRCDMVGQYLERELRRSAVVYHAGLTREERTHAQERFMGGDADIVVATNAFGMGVDKSDIRSVVHFNMPGTLEAYYQEAGRAGRDGQPAECVLLFAFGDRFLQEMFIENEYPPADVVYKIYEFLRAEDADPIEMTHAEIRERSGLELNESAVGTALKILEGASAIEKFLPRENMAIIRINAEPEEESLVPKLAAQAHVQRIALIGLEGLVNRRFGEPVYFHPDELAASLGLERTALIRAIRALVSELPIDYVPPFRGNALRVIDRGKRPRDLEIDFGSLETRKRREYDKLERMVRYAQTNQCRRAYILSYFGDSAASQVHCGHCDNCTPAAGRLDGSGGSVAIDTDAGREVILKVLSGVARAKGRFGKTIVAQMLTGSGSEKMDRWGLKRLSTFGLLGGFRQPEVIQLLDGLASAGFVEYPEVDRFRPVANLTARGWERLRGQVDHPLNLVLPPELASKVRNGGLERLSAAAPTSAGPSRTSAPSPTRATGEHTMTTTPVEVGDESDPASPLAGDPLFARLKSLRSEWAREAKQPPYCIFSNQTLELLVQSRPRDPQGLAGIKGLGPARLERHGSALLAAIAEFAVERPPNGVQATSPRVVAEARPLPLEPRPAARRPTSPQDPPPAPPPPTRPAPAKVPTPASKSPYVPTEEWTCRLLERGFAPEEAAAIRGLDGTAIVRHVTLARRQGRILDPRSFLGAELVRRWDDWRASHEEAPPTDPEVAETAWPLFLACRNAP